MAGVSKSGPVSVEGDEPRRYLMGRSCGTLKAIGRTSFSKLKEMGCSQKV